MKPISRALTLFLAFITAASVTLGALTAAAVELETQVVIVSKENSAPTAEDMTVKTYRCTPITVAFDANDPDGDELTFAVTTEPKKGKVEINSDGTFTYSPTGSKKGKDTFLYTATDTSGAVSEEAEVKITIDKSSGKVCYSDLEGSDTAYSAMVLAENDIFIGSNIGGEYVFAPNSPVTRGEFLTMCMKLKSENPLSGVSVTGFYDDEDISPWVKPYISTALMNGYISGYRDEAGHLVFAPDEVITYAQAATMLNNFLGLNNAVSVSTLDRGTDWVTQACTNLRSLGINLIDKGAGETITRSDAAKLLTSALELLRGK